MAGPQKPQPPDDELVPSTGSDLAIFDRVQYTYVNYAEVYWSPTEIRIAFADDLPVGSPQPKLGLVMTPDYAHLLHRSLSAALEQWSKLTGIPVEPSAADDPEQ